MGDKEDQIQFVQEQLGDTEFQGERRIASIECVPSSMLQEVVAQLNQKGFLTKVVPTIFGYEGTNSVDVIYYKSDSPDIQKAINLYSKYVSFDYVNDGEDTLQGLTREEHTFLGRMFGFTPEEIGWFIEDIFRKE